jgi:hypothetical protein
VKFIYLMVCCSRKVFCEQLVAHSLEIPIPKCVSIKNVTLEKFLSTVMIKLLVYKVKSKSLSRCLTLRGKTRSIDRYCLIDVCV